MTSNKRYSFWQCFGELCAMLGRLRIGGGNRTEGLALFSGADAPLFDETEALGANDETVHYPRLYRRWGGGQIHQARKPSSLRTSAIH